MLNFNRIKGFMMVEKGIGEVCADGYIGAIKRYVKDTNETGTSGSFDTMDRWRITISGGVITGLATVTTTSSSTTTSTSTSTTTSTSTSTSSTTTG